MAKIARLGIVLFAITLITGMILGKVYTVTLEPIAATKQKEKMEALAQTLPGAKEFKTLKIATDPTGTIREINIGTADGQLIGYNITVAPKGYAGLIEMVVGIRKDGQLMDIKILNHSETPGLGAKAPEAPFAGQFKNKKTENLTVVKTPTTNENEIQAISGATITSTAVATGVNEALYFWKNNLKDGGAQ
ncbi:MAG: RnfABCDGE type electron transport complex subunit G [Synergistaceae bacterium]